jgi:hypothetical protein
LHLMCVLARSLRKPKGATAGKKDFAMERVTGQEGRQMIVAGLKTPTGTYHPPVPGPTSAFTLFETTQSGRASFLTAKDARTYTAYKFLVEKKTVFLEQFLILQLQFAPKFTTRRYKVGARLIDPIKVVVLYDGNTSDDRTGIAVCLELQSKQGAFVLIDDIGLPIEETLHRFHLCR